MHKLRDYQSSLVQGLRIALRTNKRVIGVLPTGGGKTITFSHIAKGSWDKGTKVLILTDRIELLTQAGGALKEAGLDPVKIEAGKKADLNDSLHIAMSETLHRRLSKPEYVEFLKTRDLIIIDECHKRGFTKLIPYFSEDGLLIGFTATPLRDGKKDPLKDTYSEIVSGVEIEYLIANEFLARPNYYGVEADLKGVKQKMGDYDQNAVAEKFSKTKLYKGVVSNWKKRTPETKTLVFSSNIKNSLEIVDEFTGLGYEARHLDSNMSISDRNEVLKWFKDSPKGILSNVGILTTGFDEPSIETIILYRATRSLSLYLQMVGRGSRTTDTKSEFSILDFGNNIATHGFWHEAREWSLDLKKRKASADIGEAVLKNCKKCEAFIAAGAVVCPYCGHEDIREKKKQEEAELELLDPWQIKKMVANGDINTKVKLCKLKLANSREILKAFTNILDVIEFTQKMGYHWKWLERNHYYFPWSEAYVKIIK